MLKKRNPLPSLHDMQVDRYIKAASLPQLMAEIELRITVGQLAGSRFNVRGGLRSSEVIMLRRALGLYMKAYDESKQRFKEPWEIAQSEESIKAACNLDERLLRDLVIIEPTEGDDT